MNVAEEGRYKTILDTATLILLQTQRWTLALDRLLHFAIYYRQQQIKVRP